MSTSYTRIVWIAFRAIPICEVTILMAGTEYTFLQSIIAYMSNRYEILVRSRLISLTPVAAKFFVWEYKIDRQVQKLGMTVCQCKSILRRPIRYYSIIIETSYRYFRYSKHH